MIEQGNAHLDGADFGHWFIGNYAEWARSAPAAANIPGLRQSRSVEVKWGLHPTGEQRVEWAPCSPKRTMSLLVRGRFLIKFRRPEDRQTVTEMLLCNEGDYAIWGADTEHTWLVEDNALILTVRWIENGS